MGYDIAIGLLIVGMIFIIVRNVRKDHSDGRDIAGGKKSGPQPKRK